MSQENVEIVRRHLEAYLSGDNETTLSYYDPEVEFDARARPGGQVYRGHEGVAEAMRVWVGAWEDWKFEVEEMIDQPNFIVFTLRDGRIVRWQGFVHRGPALEAAGFSE